jgi:hypothetical protein
MLLDRRPSETDVARFGVAAPGDNKPFYFRVERSDQRACESLV